jgi:hypothetical protein
MTTTPAPTQADEQAPLGPEPTYDEVLDVAVEYTFPCSDPIAVDSCCGQISRKQRPDNAGPAA